MLSGESELRKDPILDRWIITSTEPVEDLAPFIREPEPRAEGFCPFCAGNEHMTPPEVLAYRSPDNPPNGQGWWVRVVPNKYPALAVEGNLGKTGRGMYDAMNGVGAHEVIIETPEHVVTPTCMKTDQFAEVIMAYRARLSAALNNTSTPALAFYISNT